ncbi:MAG: DUF2207 domain-containing protein, partial [Pseudomonadota bacterium]
ATSDPLPGERVMKLGRFTILGAFMVLVIAWQLVQANHPSLDQGESSTPAAATTATPAADTAAQTAAQTPAAAPEGEERFTDVAVTIEVTPEAEIVVTETITAVVLGEDIRHGISRQIPLTRHHRWFNSVSDIDVLSATINGKDTPYVTSVSGHTADIRIGDASVTLTPGTYTFTLKYEMDRQIGYFEDFDEIYWNVIGTDFNVTTEKASAVVTLPKDAPIRQMAAYTGTPGDSSSHGATFSKGPDGTARFETTRALPPGEAFTIAVSWPKGFVPDPSRIERLIGNPYPILISLITLVGTAIYFLVAWWQVGRDPPKGPEVPVYSPTLPAHAMRFLDQSGYDTTCFVAAIMGICAKGHARIEDDPEDKKAVVLIPVLPSDAPLRRPLSVGEQAVYDVLLSDRSAGIVLSKKNRDLLMAANDALEEAVEKRFAKGFFERNLSLFSIGAVIILAGMLASTFWEGGFATTTMITTLLFAAGVVSLLAGLYTLFTYVIGFSSQHKSRDWFARVMTKAAGWTWPFAIIAIVSAGPDFLNEVGLLPTILLVLAIIIVFVALKILPRRTALGQTTMDEIRGTRLYLGVAEADRLKFDHPPDRTPQHFSDLLPFAVALGVETAWTKQFASTIGEATMAAPTWYSGNNWSTYGWTSNNNPLASGISSAVASQRQGIGGIAGSSGGGFAGGGGGGGGAGGW